MQTNRSLYRYERLQLAVIVSIQDSALCFVSRKTMAKLPDKIPPYCANKNLNVKPALVLLVGYEVDT